ncbi:alkaline phosphatase family protein [Paenibacillus sonchi]|uniref:Alkaline phosphatase family protein n=1 Tax=Paenibacillus sonchi TaxID=373687 RepID=A0A974PFL4_9BACL|nr:alkaline phosphatase family protein [Paenibacillus sonchi]QQZ62930.1 alkaline phosphatase family protein [Paenibacillus sonchi]
MTETANKLIVVVLDGLRYDAARKYLGYMEHLVEQGQLSCYKVQSELPSLSRPLYEVLLTGIPVSRNGITANHIVRLSREQSVFHLAVAANLRTAAAAYHWVSELYSSAPFHPVADRHQHNVLKPIQHGSFYFEDHYPDSHVFADAEYLRAAYDPHFLYIHTMNIDDAGHRHGGESKEYEMAVRRVDGLLATLLPQWMEQGYTVLVTADHGMNANGCHGGVTPAERHVPLYAFGEKVLSPEQEIQALPQLRLAPLMCYCLGIQPSAAMTKEGLPPIVPAIPRQEEAAKGTESNSLA